MIWVIDAKPLSDFRLWVKFSDATQGEIDLRDFIANDQRPVVAALKNPAVFAALKADMDTVVWDNGFDLAPEFLYERVKARAAA
jgi:hypothetical protein